MPREALVWFLESRGKLKGRVARSYAVDLSAVEIVRAQDYFGASGDMILWRLQNERLVAQDMALRADSVEVNGTWIQLRG